MAATRQLEGIAGHSSWVAELPATDVACAAAIRLDIGAEGAVAPGDLRSAAKLWLRGKNLSDAVLSLPFLEIFRQESTSSDRLYPLNSQLPSRRLPDDLDWQPVAELVIPRPEVPLFPGDDFLQLAAVKVMRGGSESSPNLLRLPFAEFCDFVEKAPQIRLDHLTFAASATEVIVRGNPLPPIRGEAWVEHDDIAIPAGHVCVPDIARDVLHQSMGLVSGELGLIAPSGVVERIAQENFVPVTRSAVRLTTK